ncbi:MAG: hypothetical protein ACLGPM_00355 [Acidobacteriota bacterium]
MPRFPLFALAATALLLLVLTTPAAHAIINSTVQARLTHPFIVGNTTLPPGEYDFRMVHGTDHRVMSISNMQNTVNVEFLVRACTDSQTPRHSQLVFERYGQSEVLTNVYDSGNKYGEAVVEPSHILDRLKKQDPKPYQHTEQQSQ